MRRSFKQQLIQRQNNQLMNNDLQQSIHMEAAETLGDIYTKAMNTEFMVKHPSDKI